MMERESEHYSFGRRFSFISNAWILNESWNDKEEIAALQVDLSLRKEELRQAQAALTAKDDLIKGLDAQVNTLATDLQAAWRKSDAQSQELERVKLDYNTLVAIANQITKENAELKHQLSTLLPDAAWAMQELQAERAAAWADI